MSGPRWEDGVQVCTYARLRGGGFGVRGYGLREGQRVIVEARNGKRRTVTVRRVIWYEAGEHYGTDGLCIALANGLPAGKGYPRRGHERPAPDPAPPAPGSDPSKPPHSADVITAPGWNGLPVCRPGECHEHFHCAPDTPDGLPLPLWVARCSMDCTCASCGRLFWGTEG